MATKKNLYVCDNAQLMSEWDWEKNNALGYYPSEISYGSAKKVWWKCDEGHEWEASPNHRSKGRTCPVCVEKLRAQNRIKTWLSKYGSLADNNPKLSKQWHPTKNNDLTPQKVTVSSEKKVWWICEKGHEWEQRISTRNAGSGCPICSGHKILVGYNDLATLKPAIATQWHPSKNGDLKPTQVTLNNKNKVWWTCEKGHEWQAQISNRTHGNSCPICSGKKILYGYNDLATLKPEIAKEWHPTKNGKLTPADVAVHSNKKVWWQCIKGHEWQTAITHRSNGKRCPVCFGESKTSFPEQAIFFYLSQATHAQNRYKIDSRTEIDVYLPECNIGIEYDGIYFHKGKEAERRETQKQEKLDSLGIKLIRVKETDEIANSEISNNIIFLKPGSSAAELNKTIESLVDYINQIFNFTFKIDIDIERDRNKIYELYIESEKENSLLTLNPKLAAEWHPTKNGKLLPEYVSISSNKRVWWQCAKGHEWQAMVNTRNRDVNCPVCSGHKTLVGYNDLATVNPEIAAQWHPTKNGKLTPQDVTKNSNRKVWWQCIKGHEWQTAVSDRNSGRNCPVCAGKKVLVGYNDLETVNPKLASEWHPTKNSKLTPKEVTAGSEKKVWWQCEKGHEWESVIYSRNSENGCPYCANQKILVGFNDLATLNPKLASQWHPSKNGTLTPKNVMANSNKKAWWLGECGHEWEAVIASRNKGRGCPECAKLSRGIMHSKNWIAKHGSLAEKNPTLAQQWHPSKNGELTPFDVSPGSNKKVWWQCHEGHEWESSISKRNSGRGCPHCAKAKK